MIKNKISIILPTSNRYNVALENIQNIKHQNYSDFEIILCDDSDADYYKSESVHFQKELIKIPKTKYIYCARFDLDGKKDYGLARARNFGVIAAEGEYLVFLDDRITPANENVLSIFYNKLKSNKKVWCFGDKGAQKTSFVENFSAIRRSHLIDAGMFCERIDKYGGQSRELIARFVRQGFALEYVPAALARQVCKSGGWDKKDGEIVEMRKLLGKMWER